MNKEDPLYITRKQYHENKMEEELDNVDSFEKKTTKKLEKKLKILMKKILIVLTHEKLKW